MPGERLTACLIVEDEQERLPAALASVSFCDEVIVVDGGSRDRTVELARDAGATVIENAWPGFAAQRNVALDAAAGEWVLEIDADERVSARLRQSIQALLADPPPGVDMAVFALRNHFLGGSLGPSAKYPSYRSRLFRRGAYRHDESRAVHEGLELRERPLILDGDLEHELASTPREALLDMWRYARLESAHVRAPSSPLAYLKGLLLRPAAKLAYRTFVDGGWRDGWRGLVKIALDVTSDVLVWALVLCGFGAAAAVQEATAGEHFGRRRVGPVKVVAVAAGARSTTSAVARLLELRAHGADVALIAPRAPEGCEIPTQEVGRLGPLRVIRALEAEMHVRPIDTVAPVGRHARIVLHLVPGSLRPRIADATAEDALRSS
ncbi:MAG TPA: glycosyltransferase family 2 protein [Solirubrobacteraceae bacterium]|nr:glycosyltransferase family 2 protein [Solirubrobacteraceae bacterium]